MSNLIRAWKDETYRQSLPTQEQTTLPANPAGAIELTQAELEAVSGATGGGKNLFWEPEEVDARAEQNISNPVIMGAATTVAPTAPTCNNTNSPNTLKAVLSDLG